MGKKEESTLRIRTGMRIGFAGILLAGCGTSVVNYVKPQAPWGTISRLAVLPFTSTSENPVRREQVTQLFAAELRRVHPGEVVEIPLTSQAGLVLSMEGAARSAQADAVFTGSVDETHGTTVQINLHDAATGELLWSGSYLLGAGAEFFTLRTQQQKYQRAFRRLARDFSRARHPITASSSRL